VLSLAFGGEKPRLGGQDTVAGSRDLAPGEWAVRLSKEEPMLKRLCGLMLVVVCVQFVAHGQACSSQTYLVSPQTGNGAQAVLLQLVQGAQRSLKIALSSFSDAQLGDAVVRAFRRGVSVQVILPKAAETEMGSQCGKLAAANVPIALAPASESFRHVFAVLDETTLITGSYGWTDRAGQRTYDGVVVIRCSSGSADRSVVAGFAKEFDRLWDQFPRLQTATGSTATSVGTARVIIHTVDRTAQCVQLLNLSGDALDVSGWAISDFEGRYVFPQGTKLSPNDPYRVCSDTFNPTHDVHGLYLDPTHDEVFLVTPDGTIVDEVVW
jgi:phosphatidylserine/phosphatidylglycerophosphate/cardiolipin synthase-like enzyme